MFIFLIRKTPQCLDRMFQGSFNKFVVIAKIGENIVIPDPLEVSTAMMMLMMKNGWMDGWRDGWMGGWKNVWVDGWV